MIYFYKSDAAAWKSDLSACEVRGCILPGSSCRAAVAWPFRSNSPTKSHLWCPCSSSGWLILFKRDLTKSYLPGPILGEARSIACKGANLSVCTERYYFQTTQLPRDYPKLSTLSDFSFLTNAEAREYNCSQRQSRRERQGLSNLRCCTAQKTIAETHFQQGAWHQEVMKDVIFLISWPILCTGTSPCCFWSVCIFCLLLQIFIPWLPWWLHQ